MYWPKVGPWASHAIPPDKAEGFFFFFFFFFFFGGGGVVYGVFCALTRETIFCFTV